MFEKLPRRVRPAPSGKRSGVQWTWRTGRLWWVKGDTSSEWAWHVQAHTLPPPRAAPHPHPSAIIKFYQPGSKHPVGQDHRTLDHRAENSHRRGPCCTLIDFQVGHVISFGLFAAIRPVESLIDLPPHSKIFF